VPSLQKNLRAEKPAQEAYAVRLQNESAQHDVLLYLLSLQEHVQGEHGETREKRSQHRHPQVPLRALQFPQQLLFLRSQTRKDLPSPGRISEIDYNTSIPKFLFYPCQCIQ